MKVTLSDGRLFRVHWQHVDASQKWSPRAPEQQMKNLEEADEALFQHCVNMKGADEAHDYYLRIHAFSECHVQQYEGKEPIGPKYSAVAECSRLDAFSKEEGRKVSLGRALRNAFPGTSNLSIREVFWNAYFTRNDTNI